MYISARNNTEYYIKKVKYKEYRRFRTKAYFGIDSNKNTATASQEVVIKEEEELEEGLQFVDEENSESESDSEAEEELGAVQDSNSSSETSSGSNTNRSE